MVIQPTSIELGNFEIILYCTHPTTFNKSILASINAINAMNLFTALKDDKKARKNVFIKLDKIEFNFILSYICTIDQDGTWITYYYTTRKEICNTPPPISDYFEMEW